jgi:hypothetical protein
MIRTYPQIDSGRCGLTRAKFVAMQERIAELERLVSEMHSTSHRVSFTAETIIGGVRYEPGDYVLMRIGPVTHEDPAF